jgi:hypothetical protein
MALEPLIAEQPVTRKRYALLKYRAALSRGETHLAGVWRATLAALPVGDPLPLAFPFAARLSAAGYTERAYLDGASSTELMRELKLGQHEADEILSAFAALPPPVPLPGP